MSTRSVTGFGKGSSIVGLGFALLLTTLSALLLELSLTRLFSVVLFYHYAFLAISLAVLGLASGGMVARLLPRNLAPREHRRLMAKVCLAACVSLIPALKFTLDTNVWLVTTWETALRVAMLFVMFLIPFGLAGFVIASTIVAGSHRIASLYFYDLLGGSLGCLLFVPVMARFGGPNAVLVVGMLWAVTAVAWALGSRSRSLALGSVTVALAMAGLIAINGNGRLMGVRFMRGKPVDNEVFSAWNSFSRISVQEDQNDGRLWILIDGGAGTWLSNTDLNGPEGTAARARLGRSGPDLAFWLRQPKRAMVIGPGGGVDIVRSLAAGTEHTTAVEINPLIARDVMQDVFLQYSHGLYQRPDVEVFIEDGRSFVRRTSESFDVIQLSQVDTWASSASGSYTLTENYLYTVEAFEDYLDRLTEGGLVSVSRWEFKRPRETLRLAAVALTALERRGVTRPKDHIIVVMEDIDTEGLMRMGTVIISDTPFARRQIERLQRQIGDTDMTLAYAPGFDGGDPVYSEMITSNSQDRFFESYDFNVTPIYDDSPFFFFTGRWANTFRDLFSFDPSGDSVNTGAQFLLMAVLALAAVAVGLFIFGPLVFFKRSLPSGRRVFPFLAYCVAVGLAYIIVEIALIHRFVVFLGQPVYSLTVVIFTFLLSSSLGSRLSELIPIQRVSRSAQLVITGIVLLLIVYAFFIPWVTRTYQAEPTATKLFIVAATVFPLGFLMGMPFPSALRLAAATREHLIEWLWAVNAAATVLGSVLAIFVFVISGVRTGIVVGAISYAACALLLIFMWSTTRTRPTAAPTM